MIGYQAFAELSQSRDCDERGHAAHLAASAYLSHRGPADEQAALYAALINFLDDPSVKVRAALAYGLLHSTDAPRPIIIALLRDSPIISRAVLQYSPLLVDADLMPFVREGDATALVAMAQRQVLSPRIAAALIGCNCAELTVRLVKREDIALSPSLLCALADKQGDDANLRGALLARKDLPAEARMGLVRKVAECLRQSRIVKGALAPERLERLLQHGTDNAASVIGECALASESFVGTLMEGQQLNTRLLVHALVNGHVLFFSRCVATLADVSKEKVFALLAEGSRASVNALLLRSGLNAAICQLLGRIVILARSSDLSDDVAARHYVVTALTEELLADHDGQIPEALEEVFAYLSEQNIALARQAARGVMSAFVASGNRSLPSGAMVPMLERPAA